MKLLAKILSLITYVLALSVPAAPVAAAPEPVPLVLINEVKLGGSGAPTQYVELVNTTAQSIDLTGWSLEYAKEGFAGSCSTLPWEADDTTSQNTSILLSGNIAAATPDTYGVITIELSLTDSKSGSIQLLDTENGRHDMIGWGGQASCANGTPAPLPPNGNSIERYLDCSTDIVTTGNNAADFVVQPTPTPTGVGTVFLPECEEAEPPDESCTDLVISEIVPNPSGSDSGVEYIELFNGTEGAIALDGCYLQVGNSKLTLSGLMEPGHKAFYGLTLPNAAGGKVILVTPTTEQVVEYPPDMRDGESWSYHNDEWQLSQQSTPAATNVIIVSRPDPTEGKGSGLGPCPPGKFRNPATNRCKNIVSSSSLVPCRPGQVRNPETNRCRSIASTARALVPCKPGQERNPATNRCRSVAGSSSSLVPCKPGQERNPETNRCRKATATSSASALTNPAASQPQVSYPAIAAISALALGYGLYEYRQEITEFLRRFAKLLSGK